MMQVIGCLLVTSGVILAVARYAVSKVLIIISLFLRKS
jgi:hypothetical protein